MQAVRTHADQTRILNDLVRLQKSFFKYVDSDEEGAVRLSAYKSRADLEDYYIYVRFLGEKLGIFLWGPAIDGKLGDKWILSIATSTPGGGVPAGLLCKRSNAFYVLHNGRVTPDGRGQPFLNEPRVEVETRHYYRLGSIGDANLFPRIVEFHQNRLNELLGKASVRKGGSGFDPGPNKKTVRVPVVVDARHSPIAHELKRQMSEKGFEQIRCEMFPDLLVKKGELKILFEIKPSATLHDLIMACGQLLIYNEAASAGMLVIVTERLQRKNNFLKQFMDKHHIRIIEYHRIKEVVVFPKLGDVILS